MEESIGFCSVCGNASKSLRMIFHNNKWYCRECFYKMGTSVIPNKLKEELEDVKKVYDYGKTICTHPNSFDRLQTEIVKVCDVNKELEKENAELKNRNQELLESCEGATMMYKHLIKAKGIIKKYLSIGVGGKITQNYLDVTKEAEQFLKE